MPRAMSRRDVSVWMAVLLAVGVYTSLPGASQETGLAGAAAKRASVAAFLPEASDGRLVPVIVGFDAAVVPEGTLTPTGVAAQRQRLADAGDAILAQLPRGSASGVKRFATIPYFAAQVDADALQVLGGLPQVTSVVEDVPEAPLLSESMPLIQANRVGGGGLSGASSTGTNWHVAVLDTGIDQRHEIVAGRTVVSEACYSTTDARSTSVCPGGANSIADGSGANCPSSLGEGCGHGTQVAGSAVGSASGLTGVAPAAGIIAIQVFSAFGASEPACGGSPCVLAWTSDQILGLERVLALSRDLHIASVSLRLGGRTRYTSAAPCDAANGARKAAIDHLRSVNIATVVASGRAGDTNGMSAPACISTVAAVGSTTKDGAASLSSSTATGALSTSTASAWGSNVTRAWPNPTPGGIAAATTIEPVADGSIDTSFNPGANGGVYALAVQPDGKILVGGDFTMLGGGGSGTTARAHIGRLNTDGSLDTSFNPGANDFVYALAVQPDGRILVSGKFTTLGGGGTGTTTRNRIGRLNADGSLDASFNPSANAPVVALAVQPDGKILVGGDFTTLGGGGTGTTTRRHIGRLNADGSLDTSFDPGASDYVEVMAVQPDGKIVVGGNFTTLGGGGRGTTTRNYIGRLNADGSLDAGFNPGADDQFNPLVVQRDGKILVGGAFKMLGGGGTGTTARNYIGRLNADGSLDTGFNPGANFFVLALAVQADGKILVGGEFSALGGGGTGTTARNGIGRLNADGSLDAGFNPGANDLVAALAVQPDGRILVVGEFTTLGGGGTGTTTRNRIGRLDVDSQGPGAPSGLTASASGTSVALAWSAPTTGGAPAAYTIEAGSGPGLTNLANFSTGNTATTFAASGVGSGTYYLRVRATNNAGTSGPSNEAIMVVGGGGCTVPPGAPGGFTLTQNSGGNVAFRWTAAAGGPTTYVLEAGSAPGLANLANVDLGGTGTTFATSGVGAGTYYVRVRARNACGLGAASNELVLLVSTACGDERDSIISEYRAYEVPWTPTCSDFATGGGTTNFSWTELNRLPGSGHPPWGIIRQVLWEGLENTRSQYNRGRVTITSGYRCPHGNADPSIRGATSSRHLYGDAADMKSMDHPWSYDEWDLLRGAAIRAGAWIEPYELSPSHVHADWWGGRTMPSTAFALADRTLGRVPADQEQIAGRLESDSHNERMAAIGSVLTIPLLERQLSLELALTRELARLREQNSLRRQARLAAESLAPPVDEGEYLFSLIEAVSQSANPDIIAALVPWLGTGNRAINAVAALGDRSVSEIATVAMDPTDEEASVALLVLRQMILDQVRHPLSAASRRMIVNSAERRLVGIQRVAVLQEAIELAVATGDTGLVARVESFAENPNAVRDCGISDQEAIGYIQEKAAKALSKYQRR